MKTILIIITGLLAVLVIPALSLSLDPESNLISPIPGWIVQPPTDSIKSIDIHTTMNGYTLRVDYEYASPQVYTASNKEEVVSLVESLLGVKKFKGIVF